MRTLLLTTVAAFALSTAAAQAGGFWFLGKVIHECYEEFEDSVVNQCAYNELEKAHDAGQNITQRAKYEAEDVEEDDMEQRIVQIAVNDADKVSDAEQSVTQTAKAEEEGGVYEEGPLVSQVGVNEAEKASGIEQSISQSASVDIDYED
jgi:hypothetical protein